MRTATSVIFLVLLVILCGKALAYGPPNYLPDGSHPRIWLNSSVLSTLQAKVIANDQDWLNLKAHADVLVNYAVPAYDRNANPANSINYAYQGLPWLDAAQTLGLAYKMTGKNTYAAKLKQLIDAINAAGTAPILADTGYPSRSVAVSAALIYDWLYDYLDSTTKTSTVATINAYYASYASGSGWYAIPGPAVDNYFGGHLLGFGLCSIATYGDNPTAPTILTDIRTKWNNVIVPSFATGGFAGGDLVESYSYGANHTVRLLQYASAIQTSTGEDIYSPYLGKLANSLMYNLKPNRWQATDTGDWSGDFTGIMPSNLSIVLSSLSSDASGDYMAWFYSHLTPTPYSTADALVQKADTLTNFLYKNSRTPVDYRLTAPLAYRSIGNEQFYTRSDWTDNAVWSSYYGGNIIWSDHQLRMAGHISIQRGNDYLLVNAGQWKGPTGTGGDPSVSSRPNKWANTLFFYDNDTYMYTGGTYDGGQSGLMAEGNNIVNYEMADNYTYVKADHTNAYDKAVGSRNPSTRSLRYFYRNFVKVGDKTFVIYDRVKALQTSFPKRLHWHLNSQGQPVDLGNKTTSSTVGSSKLFIKSVYPTTSIVTFAQDINSSSQVTTPRVEIADSATATDFNPLTVLIADSKTATMPPTELVQSIEGKMIGTYIKSPLNPTVVLFSNNQNGADVVVSSSDIITYTLPGIISSSLQHILVHLPPNTDFTSLPTSSANGLITFRLKAGAFPTEGMVYRASSQGVIRYTRTSSIGAPTVR